MARRERGGLCQCALAGRVRVGWLAGRCWVRRGGGRRRQKRADAGLCWHRCSALFHTLMACVLCIFV